MKKILASVAILILATGLSWAVRAPRTPFTYTQPDGSVITLVNHGDEFHHWTTWNGTLVEMDEKHKLNRSNHPSLRVLDLRIHPRLIH